MKNSVKRTLALLMAGVLAVGMTACGGGNAGSGSSSGSGSASGSGASAESSDFVLYAWGDNHMDIYQEMAAEFNKANPNYKFTYEQDNSLTDFLTTRAASNKLPDMFYTEPYSGVANWSAGEWLTDLSDEAWAQDLPDSVREAVSVDGKVVAFPYSVCYTGFFYDKDVFAELGLSVPKTIGEFKDVCEKLKAAGYESPVAVGGGAGSEWVLYQLFNSLVGAALDEDVNDFVAKMNAGETSFHDIKGIENVEEMFRLATVEYNQKNALDMDYSAMVTAFATKKAAIYHNGSWSVADAMKIDPELSVGVFAYPISDNAADARLTYDAEIAVAVSKNSDALTGCKDFLNYLADSNTGAASIAKQSRMPIAPVEMDKEIVSDAYDEAMTYVESGEVTGWMNWRGPTGFNDAIGGDLQEYMMGNITFSELLDRCDQKWEANLNN